MKDIDFYYFSGTGNTLLVVKEMAKTFEENGIKVTLRRMEKSDSKDIDLNKTIGLGFPVAEQGTYPFVWDFVNTLPDAHRTPIFMVDTLMAYSGGAVGPMKKIVKEKGYEPIGAKEIVMPNSLMVLKIKEKKNARKVQKGLKKAREYALDILNGKAKWSRVPGGSDLMALSSKNERGWKTLGKFVPLILDEEKCVKCGLCVKLCPIDNIVMKEYPEIKDECLHCLRCFAFCPSKAIAMGKKDRFLRYSAVKANDLLKDE